MTTLEKREYNRIYQSQNAEALKIKKLKYLAENKEAVAARKKAWADKNKDRIIARSKSYYAEKGDSIRQKSKKYAVEHPDYVYNYQKAYRQKHAATVKLYMKAYHAAYYKDPVKREQMSAQAKLYAKSHPEVRRKAAAKYHKKHPETSRHNNQIYRALKKKASINLIGIKGFIRTVKSKSFALCYYCQKKTSTFGCHFDHIIPLSKGGLHSVDNLCVTCPSCNSSKSDKLIDAWVRVGQQVLSL